jgi:hypothetical protein
VLRLLAWYCRCYWRIGYAQGYSMASKSKVVVDNIVILPERTCAYGIPRSEGDVNCDHCSSGGPCNEL